MIVIDQDKCNRCGVCLEKCDVFIRDGDDIVIDRNRCINCNGCPNNCPEGAVVISMDDPQRHVYETGNVIMVTNRCGQKCGGCCQFCPNLPSKDRWDITPEEFYEAVHVMVPWYRIIAIYGGDPCRNPNWEAIMTMMEMVKRTRWEIFTTAPLYGHSVPKNHDNIGYIWENDIRSTGHYIPTLVAAKDIYRVKDKNWYFDMACKNCWVIRESPCKGILFKGKSYYCQVAAAFDDALGIGFGWDVEEGVHPFDRSLDDIYEQARHACYRCAFCVEPRIQKRLTRAQKLDEPSLVSPINADMFTKRVEVISAERCAEFKG